jgi:hypothetical protein
LTDVVENRSGIITVDDAGRVYGNGIYDGQFNVGLTEDTNGIERAYAIKLYQPAPKRVLIIGMSSGSWSQVIANLPDVESVTIVEINPGYAKLIAARPTIASLLHNPKVTLIVDDGRRWLMRNPGATFDAVVSNTSFHFRANATNVLSLEFMDLVRHHLRPGGVFFYNTTESMRALRTGCIAFRHGVRIENFVAVGDSPMDLDGQRWRDALAHWQIDGKPVLDLAQEKDRAALRDWASMPNDMTDPSIHDPALKRVEDCASIRARTAQYTPITDDNMGTEWRFNLGFAP